MISSAVPPTYIIFHRLDILFNTLAAVSGGECHMQLMRRHEGGLVPVLFDPEAIHGDIHCFITAQVVVGDEDNRRLETYGINVVTETVPRLENQADMRRLSKEVEQRTRRIGHFADRHLKDRGLRVRNGLLLVPGMLADLERMRGMSPYWQIVQPNPYDVFSRRVEFPELPEQQQQADTAELQKGSEA